MIKKTVIILGLALASASAFAAQGQSNYQITITNKTQCPMEYQLTSGGGKQVLNVGENTTKTQAIGQQTALYEEVKLNGTCTIGASTGSASISDTLSLTTTVQQGLTSWVSTPVTMQATFNRAAHSVGSGATVKEPTTGYTINLIVNQ